MIYLAIALLISVLGLVASVGALFYMFECGVERMSALTAAHSAQVNAMAESFAETLQALVASAQAERAQLEDRMMALTQPDQLTLFKAHDEVEAASISFDDEPLLDPLDPEQVMEEYSNGASSS